jgi:hypothetical protein
MFRIRAGPAQRLTHINFSAKYDLNSLQGDCFSYLNSRVERLEDSNVQADENDDSRRITSLYLTSVDTVPPIHFATPHPVGQEERE